MHVPYPLQKQNALPRRAILPLREKPCSTGLTPGFTLFEIVVVILLMAVLAAVVIPKVMDSDEPNLRVETDVLANHLRYAQSMAMGTLTPYGITYSSGSYHLFKGSAPNTALGLPGEQDTTVSLPSGMTVTFSTAASTITFNAMGVPCSDTAGTTPLTADAVLTVGLSGDSKTITVTQQTGFIP